MGRVVLREIQPDVKLVCVYNFKGGVGKTTTAHNLAVAMMNEGIRVLVVDLDAQCNLTSALNDTVRQAERMVEEKGGEFDERIVQEPESNLYKMFMAYADGDHITDDGTGSGHYRSRISAFMPAENTAPFLFLPGTHFMYEIEQWHNARKDSLRDRFKLVSMLMSLAQEKQCTHVVVDMNPGDSLVNRTLLFRSDCVVVPTFLDHASISSTSIFLKMNAQSIAHVGLSRHQQMAPSANRVMVAIAKYKMISTNGERGLVQLHAKYLTLLQALCTPHECKLLCPEIETGAMKKVRTCLVDVTSAGDEQWKINAYKTALLELVERINARAE
jgi:cellulose biosynthesis protein BcsQ